MKKFKNKIDNFYKWVKGTELVELDAIDPKEDPVRPELDVEWRKTDGRIIYGLKFKEDIECEYWQKQLIAIAEEFDKGGQRLAWKG